jgi:hypothetical protein
LPRTPARLLTVGGDPDEGGLAFGHYLQYPTALHRPGGGPRH